MDEEREDYERVDDTDPSVYLSIAEYQKMKFVRWHDLATVGAIEVINGLAGKRGSVFGFSFRDSQNPKHQWQTALTLEYASTELAKLLNAIQDFPQAMFIIPTRSGRTDCHLLAIPILEPVHQRQARRASHLIAQYLSRPNMTPNSESPTFRFNLRDNLPPHYRSGPILNVEQLLSDSTGIATQVRKFHRKK